MNLDFKNINFKSMLPLVKRFGPMIMGLVLVGLFGYTGWVINGAFNVQPAAAPETSPAAKITFDKKTVDYVKNLHVVPGQVAPADLGKSDPFGN